MKALLYLQIKNNSKSILLILFIPFCISLFSIRNDNTMLAVIYALIFTTSSFRHISLLKEQKMRYFVHSFPIARRDIVTAEYTSVFIHIIMIYAVLLPAQIYADFQQTEGDHLLIPFAGFFAVSIGSAAIELYLNFRSKHFTGNMTDSLLGLFAALFFILFPHLGLLLIWEHEPSLYLRLLIFPVVSMILFYFSLQKSIRLYETKEVL